MLLRRGGSDAGIVLQPKMDVEQLLQVRDAAHAVNATDNLLDYLQRLVTHSRQSPEFATGLSPRGALALLDAARTWALMNHRSHVVPEDLQAVLPAVAGHRLVPASNYRGDGRALVMELLQKVDVISS
jgi:MoxR-like ATPase